MTSKKKSKKKNKDTTISLHPLEIEEALKIAMDAGPMPKKDTKASGHQHSEEGHKSDQHPKSSGD
jgi:hypothetical protein